MKFVLVYDEYGNDNLETWTLYATKVPQLPDEIDNNFIDEYFVRIVESQCSMDGNIDACYERFADDSKYHRVY